MTLDFFRHLVDTQDSTLIYLISLIAIAMMMDFITGTIAAYVNPEIEFKSKAGINGILRKIASLLLLLFFIPVSVLIPGEVGAATCYTLYGGYLLFEIKSIIENIGKNGTDTTLFEKILETLKFK